MCTRGGGNGGVGEKRQGVCVEDTTGVVFGVVQRLQPTPTTIFHRRSDRTQPPLIVRKLHIVREPKERTEPPRRFTSILPQQGWSSFFVFVFCPQFSSATALFRPPHVRFHEQTTHRT